MRKELIEETILFASVFKWFILASVVGALVGFSTTLFLMALQWLVSFPMHLWKLALLPVGLFVSSLLTYYLAPSAEGHGTEKVIEAIHQHDSRIPLKVVPVKLLATVVTLATGGSAGKEGPCAQIGAGLASAFCSLFHVNETDRRKLVVCGVSAGFASVFGTPLAGALFGVEVLAVGRVYYSVLFPSFVAGIMGYHITHVMGMGAMHYPLEHIQLFNERLFIEISLAGVIFGLFSCLFIEMFKLVEVYSHRLQVWKPLKGLLGGLILVLIALLFSDRYLGLGLNTIDAVLAGKQMGSWFDPIMKICASSVTLAFGGSGGIITPIFFTGATLGSALSGVMHIDSTLMAALGMVGMLAGCTNTPIAASVMALELFGPEIGLFAGIVSVISFLVTGHRSVYPSQILAIRKSDTLSIEIGIPLIETSPAEYCRLEQDRLHDFEQ